MNLDDAVKRVMVAIAIGPRQIKLPYTAPDGTQPLVVATPNEYVSAVIERIEAVGGHANIALAEARKFTLFVMEAEDSDSPSDDGDINRELSMGMLFLRIAHSRKRTNVFKVNGSDAKVPGQRQEFAYA